MIIFALLILILVAVLVWLFTKQDCDLEVLWALKFGRSIDTLKGKVVWVTGASSGVGEHLAYVLASVGSKLVLSGTKKDRLEEVAQQCISIAQYDPENVLVLSFDIADSSCHQEMFDQVLKHFGKLDILVNNAGRSQRSMFHQIDLDVDKALFEINVFGLVNLTRVVLRYFMEYNPDGQFAVTSSTAGLLGVPFSASYTGSKHALHGYFECLRTELGTRGISISMLCLGPVFSNLLHSVFMGKIEEKYDKRHEANSRRMSTERCAYLMAVSIANRIDQAWIAIQPVLAMHYFSQYLPQFSRKLLPKYMTVERINKIREGK